MPIAIGQPATGSGRVCRRDERQIVQEVEFGASQPPSLKNLNWRDKGIMNELSIALLILETLSGERLFYVYEQLGR